MNFSFESITTLTIRIKLNKIKKFEAKNAANPKPLEELNDLSSL